MIEYHHLISLQLGKTKNVVCKTNPNTCGNDVRTVQGEDGWCFDAVRQRL